MTITPDQAQHLLDGATPGPWRALHDQWEDEDGTPCEDFYVLGGPDGILHTEDFDPDTHNPVANTTLAAAAPDLAQTIAGMEWEYGLRQPRPEPHAEGELYTSWGYRLFAAKAAFAGLTDRGVECYIVRRLVGPVEVIDGE